MADGVFPAIRQWPRVQRWRQITPIMLRSRASAVLFLGVLPVAMYIPAIRDAVTGERSGSDFPSFWRAGRAVWHLGSPYPLVDALPAVADQFTFAPFVYPAPAAFGMVPFAALPYALALSLFLVIGIGSIVVALRALGVRDWRCYGAAFASVPAIAGTSLGTFSPLLLLGAAAAWRYRDRTLRVAPIVAALVVTKLFLWPVWLWLVYTRRFAAAAISAALGLVLTVGAWALIGFAGLRDYPRLLSRLTELVGTQSYSPFALLHTEGLGSSSSQRIVLVIGVVLIAASAVAFRAVRTDERAFVAALGLGLFLTPILWPHYLVLMYIPIAFARKTFSGLWLFPLLLWCEPFGWSHGDPLKIAPVLCLAAVPFLLVLRRAE